MQKQFKAGKKVRVMRIRAINRTDTMRLGGKEGKEEEVRKEERRIIQIARPTTSSST